MRRGIDISNWQYPLSDHEIRGWKADDIAVILGCQRSVTATKMQEHLRVWGITPHSYYCFLYWGYNPDYEVAKVEVVAAALPEGPKFIWMDCENNEDSLPATPEERVATLKRAIEYANQLGFQCGVYTNGHFWQNEMGNSTEFSHLPLWYANWTTDEPIATVDFGGWTNVTVHQYTSTPKPPYYGRGNLDMNWMVSEGEDMAKIDELEAQVKQLQEDVAMLNNAVLLRFDILRASIALAAQPDLMEAMRDHQGVIELEETTGE